MSKYLIIVALLLSPFLSDAFNIEYNNPIWDDIDQTNPPKKTETTPITNQIAHEASEDTVTAFKFCEALGYNYISHLDGGTATSSVVWKNNRWEVAGAKDDFLRITCDNKIIATTSSSTIIVNATVETNPIDYTMYFLYFMILASVIFFALIVLYIHHLIRKFL